MPLRYQMLGFDSRNFFLNSGTLFWLFLSWVFLAVLWLLFKGFSLLVKNQYLRTFLRIASFWIFFNFLIRVLLESYIDLTISAFINVKRLKTSKSGEESALFFSYIVLGFLFVFLIASFSII